MGSGLSECKVHKENQDVTEWRTVYYSSNKYKNTGDNDQSGVFGSKPSKKIAWNVTSNQSLQGTKTGVLLVQVQHGLHS